MAYATADRIGRIKANPQPKKEGFLLGDGEVIYAHTLFGVLAADGKAVNLSGNAALVSAIMYADQHLEAGTHNSRVLSSDPYETAVEGLNDIVVYLDASGLSAGDEGSDAFLADDHTITLDGVTGSPPYVGKIEKVIDATYAAVWVPGLYRD